MLQPCRSNSNRLHKTYVMKQYETVTCKRDSIKTTSVLSPSCSSFSPKQPVPLKPSNCKKAGSKTPHPLTLSSSPPISPNRSQNHPKPTGTIKPQNPKPNTKTLKTPQNPPKPPKPPPNRIPPKPTGSRACLFRQSLPQLCGLLGAVAGSAASELRAEELLVAAAGVADQQRQRRRSHWEVKRMRSEVEIVFRWFWIFVGFLRDVDMI